MNRFLAKILQRCPVLVQLLVNRDPRVFDDFCRWVSLHPDLYERSRLTAGLVLLGINLKYLCCGFLLRPGPYTAGAESSLHCPESPESLAEKLSRYDVVSFDVFDTLLFRAFHSPQTVFDVVGERLQCRDFAVFRKEAEASLWQRRRETGAEYDLEDICRILAATTGIPAEKLAAEEMRAERECCYANPCMLEVFRRLLRCGKEIIITSDMYFHRDFLAELLEKNGFAGFRELFVSCDEGSRKFDGGLFRKIAARYPGKKLVHVGDHAIADLAMPRAAGWEAVPYRNVNETGNPFRSVRGTPQIRSVYAGIVNAHLHAGMERYSVPYEYGFVYGGLYVYGFCRWLHEEVRAAGCEKILFVARDGDVLKRAYDVLFPGSASVYFLWSRVAAQKYASGGDLRPLLDLMIRQRLNDTVRYSVGEVLASAGCDFLAPELPDGIRQADALSGTNAEMLCQFMEKNRDRILSAFRGDLEAVRTYVRECLGESRRIAIADIGWTGSCVLSVKRFIREHVAPDAECRLLMGAYCRKGMEPPLLLSAGIRAYLFGESFNRDLKKEHGKAFINTLLFEMFTASTNPYLAGFRMAGGKPEPVYFPKMTGNDFMTEEIQRGILDFIREYDARTVPFPWLREIAGSDAYLPFAWIRDHKEYFRRHFGSYILESVPGIRQTGGELKKRV